MCQSVDSSAAAMIRVAPLNDHLDMLGVQRPAALGGENFHGPETGKPAYSPRASADP